MVQSYSKLAAVKPLNYAVFAPRLAGESETYTGPGCCPIILDIDYTKGKYHETSCGNADVQWQMRKRLDAELDMNDNVIVMQAAG